MAAFNCGSRRNLYIGSLLLLSLLCLASVANGRRAGVQLLEQEPSAAHERWLLEGHEGAEVAATAAAREAARSAGGRRLAAKTLGKSAATSTATVPGKTAAGKAGGKVVGGKVAAGKETGKAVAGKAKAVVSSKQKSTKGVAAATAADEKSIWKRPTKAAGAAAGAAAAGAAAAGAAAAAAAADTKQAKPLTNFLPTDDAAGLGDEIGSRPTGRLPAGTGLDELKANTTGLPGAVKSGAKKGAGGADLAAAAAAPAPGDVPGEEEAEVKPKKISSKVDKKSKPLDEVSAAPAPQPVAGAALLTNEGPSAAPAAEPDLAAGPASAPATGPAEGPAGAESEDIDLDQAAVEDGKKEAKAKEEKSTSGYWWQKKKKPKIEEAVVEEDGTVAPSPIEGTTAGLGSGPLKQKDKTKKKLVGKEADRDPALDDAEDYGTEREVPSKTGPSKGKSAKVPAEEAEGPAGGDEVTALSDESVSGGKGPKVKRTGRKRNATATAEDLGDFSEGKKESDFESGDLGVGVPEEDEEKAEEVEEEGAEETDDNPPDYKDADWAPVTHDLKNRTKRGEPDEEGELDAKGNKTKKATNSKKPATPTADEIEDTTGGGDDYGTEGGASGEEGEGSGGEEVTKKKPKRAPQGDDYSQEGPADDYGAEGGDYGSEGVGGEGSKKPGGGEEAADYSQDGGEGGAAEERGGLDESAVDEEFPSEGEPTISDSELEGGREGAKTKVANEAGDEGASLDAEEQSTPTRTVPKATGSEGEPEVEEEEDTSGSFSILSSLEPIVAPFEAFLSLFLTPQQIVYVGYGFLGAVAIAIAVLALVCYCRRRQARHGAGLKYQELSASSNASVDLNMAFGQGAPGGNGRASSGGWDNSWGDDWSSEGKKIGGVNSSGGPNDALGNLLDTALGGGKGSGGESASDDGGGGGGGLKGVKKASAPAGEKKKKAGGKLVVTKGKGLVNDEGWDL